MLDLFCSDVAGRHVRVAVSERADGDMNPRRVPHDVLRGRQHRLIGTTWPMLAQVHGTAVGRAQDGWVGDIAVSEPGDHPVAVWAADCAPIALVGSQATLVMAHAGWRGIVGGVIDAAIAQLTSRGEAAVHVVVGPTIGPCCYAFGHTELHDVAAALDVDEAQVRGLTGDGDPALDMRACVDAGLRRRGLRADLTGPCTRCDTRFFSHRRGDPQRHAMVAWSS